ncbi:unnamed protein product [Ilex paraguariensis]|uniref:Uncharacterized protein n=1 Tax=Ilex paraguariensis TaxID=185542 RepID=A0ABC8SFK8_9AQUA
MEVERLCSGAFALERMVCSALEAVVVDTALVAQKTLVWLILLIVSVPNDIDMLPNPLGEEKSFPLRDLNRVTRPDAENKDASDTEDDEDEDNDADVNDEDDDEFSGEEVSDDDEGDSEDDVEANGDGGSDDDDDDDDDSDEDDDDDSDEDEGEEEDDEEEQNQPPFKKKK